MSSKKNNFKKKWERFKAFYHSWDSGEVDLTEPLSEHPDGQVHLLDRSKMYDWENRPITKLSQAELRSYNRLYPMLAGVLSAVIITVLLMTVAYLPRFGAADNPTLNEVYLRYVEMGLAETGALNTVTGVILDYRAFDTLGESHVLYTAVTAVLILLLSDSERGEKGVLGSDIVVKNTAKAVIPAIFVFGIYIILNGHLSPGGGFAGGAIIGSGLILYSLTYGFKKLERGLNLQTFRAICLSALCFYSLSKCYSFFCGANGYETIFSTGTPGEIFSAGLILPLNLAVGIVVACTMYGLYSLFQRGRI